MNLEKGAHQSLSVCLPGANVEAANALGSTSLISASQLGNFEVVSELVTAGNAKLNAVIILLSVY